MSQSKTDILNALRALGIDLRPSSGGAVKVRCPRCSDHRSNKADRCLSVNVDEGLYNCHHCGWKGSVNKSKKEAKAYVVPKWTNNTGLPENVVKWFEGRGISQRVLTLMDIAFGNEFMPQRGREVQTIQFPYKKDGRVVNVKYRSNSKDFKMVGGAELIFYNLDAIKDSSECLIIEGEMDALTFIEAEYMTVVSVPNGASKGSLKLEYLDNCLEYFENKTRIIIGTDNDEAGRALAKELIRRLGDEKCYTIDYGDCKDGNEYALKYGKLSVLELVEKATPVPVKGIFDGSQIYSEVIDIYDKGLPPGLKIDLGDFDQHLSFIPGQMTMVTGIPSHGKSEFLDEIMIRMAVKHDWKFGIFSPENYPLSFHTAKMIEKIIGKGFRKEAEERVTKAEVDMAMDFIKKHFFFIRPDNENYSLDNILAIGKKLVTKYGANSIVIDPWNHLEHQVPPGVAETTHINNQLSKAFSFKQRTDTHLFIVAHPRKMNKAHKSNKYEVPTLYDISMSAHFFNKTDNGICVYRDFEEKRIEVYVQKVKFKHLGKTGKVDFVYDYLNGRFNPLGRSFYRSNMLDALGSKAIPQMEDAPVPEDEIPF